MSFGHVGSVATILSYEKADKYFNDTKEHKRCKDWQPHERCLKSRASGNRHYRIERHKDGEYYDVCLYSTVMARFYKPTAEGHSRVLYAGHSSVTSKSFMYRVLGVWETKSMLTTDNRHVVAPVYNDNVLYDTYAKFSLDMTLDAERNLIVDKSRHTPHYTHKSNDEDKARRARIKEKFANYIMLAQMRMPEYAENCVPTNSAGRPFGGGNTNYSQRMAVESLWEGGSEVEQHWVDHFFDLCQDIYDTLVSKRGYEQGGFQLRYYYNSNNAPASTPDDLEKPVTEKDFEKAILNKVFRLVGANAKSEAVLQPQFMDKDSYPRSSITTYP